MPSFHTHVRYNLFVALPLATAILWHYQLPIADAMYFAGSFVYATMIVHPDIDLAYQTKTLSFKGLLTLPFLPYSWIFRHRGISHIPVIGTLTRLLYLSILLWVLKISTWPIGHELMWIFIGMATADVMHELLDRIEKIVR